jgi:DNA recombination protein Rad52
MKLFTQEQTELLRMPLDSRIVLKRTQQGRELSYIEGWKAIDEANRIFGFDGWHRETIELREIRPAEVVTNPKTNKDTWRVGFIAKVRVTVGAMNSGVVREGTGYGSGAMPDLGDAYESAVKEAETDAMKRALMTFGNPFGLALYDKTQANVGTPTATAAHMKRELEALRADLVDVHNDVALKRLWTEWRARMNRDSWPECDPQDETAFRNVAISYFGERRRALEAQAEAETASRELHPLEAV